MALKLHTTYPGRFDSPSENYPQGKWRNRSNSTAHDGGYLEEQHMNDIYGFFGALLRNAEMSPNGEVDTAKKSQFYDALVAVAKKAVGEEGYRKLDDNVFNGLVTIRSDNDEQGVGISLQESDGTVRGQVVATDQGLQLAQYPKDGGLQTFTFPNEGGELVVDSNVLGSGNLYKFKPIVYQGIKDSYHIGEGVNNFKDTYSNGTQLGRFKRIGLSPNNVIQSLAIDNINKIVYIQHVTQTGSIAGEELSVINTIRMGDNTAFKSSKGDSRLGHQGLAYQHGDSGGFLWTSAPYGGGNGNYAVRFRANFKDGEDVGEIERFKLFDFSNTSQSTTPSISLDGKYLLVKHNLPGNKRALVRIFELETLKTSGDYSSKYLHELEIPLDGFQSMLFDGRYISYLATGNTVSEADSGRMVTVDLEGNIVDSTVFKVGLEDAISTGSGVTYEPEGLAWYLNATGQYVPTTLIVSGDGGSRVVSWYQLGTSTEDNLLKLGSSGYQVGSLRPTAVIGTDSKPVTNLQLVKYIDNTQGHIPALDVVKLREGEVMPLVSGERIGSIRFGGETGIYDRQSGVRGGVGSEISSSVQGDVVDGNLKSSIDIRTKVDGETISISWRFTADGKLLPMQGGDIGHPNYRVGNLYLDNQPNVASDVRFKENIQDIPDVYLSIVADLKFKMFTSNLDGGNHFGVIAQDWIATCEKYGVDPLESGVINGNDRDGYSIRYAELQILFNAYILRKLNE